MDVLLTLAAIAFVTAPLWYPVWCTLRVLDAAALRRKRG